MKNVRLDGLDFIYDCDGLNCATPGVPHRVSLNTVMATLEACYSEFLYNRDPRLEVAELVMNYLWRLLYDEGLDGREFPYNAPWDSELKKLMHLLENKYGGHESTESHTHHTHEHPTKKLLN